LEKTNTGRVGGNLFLCIYNNYFEDFLLIYCSDTNPTITLIEEKPSDDMYTNDESGVSCQTEDTGELVQCKILYLLLNINK